MTDARQTALRRIQKLQALAESEARNGNDTAAESAARMAARLMVRHAIEARDVDAAAEAAADPMQRRETRTGRQLEWLRALYHCVALANNCTTSIRRNSDCVNFYGRASDCEIAEYLAIHLAREIQRRADAHLRAYRKTYGYTPRGERNSFCHSAVSALNLRLQAMRREAMQEATQAHGEAAASNALVRLDNRLAEALAFAQGHGLRKGRKVRYSHNSAGTRAGNDININRGVAGNAARTAQIGS